MPTHAYVAFLIAAMAALSASPSAADWPRWRGPQGDGTWHAPPLPDQWPVGGPKRVWSVPILGGYAGISVADGRVFTMDRETLARSNDSDGNERVLCFDADTGKTVWSHKYPTKYGDLGGYANGPRAAPTIFEGRVYSLGAVGHFCCFDSKSGQVLWQKDLAKEQKARVPMWGFAASPLIHGRLVIVHVGAESNGCVLAFDRLTGKEVWRSLDDPAGYATPMIADTPGQPTLLVWTPENVNGLDPDTGRVLWSVPYRVTYGVSIATPIYRDGLIFVTGYWEGSKAIRIGPKPSDHMLAWEDNRHLRGLMAQPLYRNGYVYSLDKQHGLTCFDLKSGKKLWDDANRLTPKGRNPHASIVWLNNSDRIIAVNSVGELILARLTPEGYHEQSRVRILNGHVWGHPGFAGNRMFVRTDGAENWRSEPFELTCFELTK
jgi:outer membrane protein assembly factor BamB